MTYSDILYTVENMVATITLNRPTRLNAMTMKTYQEIDHAIQTAESDKDVRAVIITGAGRGFCSGDDVKEIPGGVDPYMTDWSSDSLIPQPGKSRPSRGKPTPLAETLFNFDKPLIAAVNGACIGWGMDLALMCDIRIAAEEAKFGEVFVLRGIIPDIAGTLLLPKIVGLSKAYELLLTGRMVEGPEAEKIGLVSQTVSQEDLMPTVRAMAEHMASLPPMAVRMTKEAVRRALNYDLSALGDYHSFAMKALFESEDFAEGSTALLDKRKPVFHDK